MELDLGDELGATAPPSAQRLSLYVPNKDCDGQVIAEYEAWCTEAQELLTAIGGGATAFPPVDGTWKRPDGSVLWERTTIMYTYVDAEKLTEKIGQLREFLHRFGRETNQGEVIVEFDGLLWRINAYDSTSEEYHGNEK